MANSTFKETFEKHYPKFVELYKDIEKNIKLGFFSDIQKVTIKNKNIPFRFYKSLESTIGVIEPNDVSPHIPQFKQGSFYFYDSKLKNTLSLPKSLVVEEVKKQMTDFENKEQLLHVSLGIHEIEDLLLGKEITVPFESKNNKGESKNYSVRANIRNFLGSKENLLTQELTSYPSYNHKLTKED